MTKQQMGAFACRILAMLVFIQALDRIQGLVYGIELLVYHPFDVEGTILSQALASTFWPFFTFFCFGVLLLVCAVPLGRYLAGRPDAPDAPVSVISAADLQTAGFSMIGLFTLVTAIPGLIPIVVAGFLNPTWQYGSLSSLIIQATGPLLQFILGFYLFLNAGNLAHFWRSAQASKDREAHSGTPE